MSAKKLLDAATSTGAGSNITNGLSEYQSVQINITGAPTAVVVAIEGSLDSGVTWDALVEKTFSAGELSAGLASLTIVGQPRDVIRHNLTTLTGGSSPTVTSFHGSEKHSNPS